MCLEHNNRNGMGGWFLAAVSEVARSIEGRSRCRALPGDHSLQESGVSNRQKRKEQIRRELRSLGAALDGVLLCLGPGQNCAAGDSRMQPRTKEEPHEAVARRRQARGTSRVSDLAIQQPRHTVQARASGEAEEANGQGAKQGIPRQIRSFACFAAGSGKSKGSKPDSSHVQACLAEFDIEENDNEVITGHVRVSELDSVDRSESSTATSLS